MLLLGAGVVTLCTGSWLFLTQSMVAPIVTSDYVKVEDHIKSMMDVLAQHDERSLSQFFADTQTANNFLSKWKRIRESKGGLKTYRITEVRFYPELVVRVRPNSAGVEAAAEATVAVSLEQAQITLEIEMSQSPNGYRMVNVQIK